MATPPEETTPVPPASARAGASLWRWLFSFVWVGLVPLLASMGAVSLLTPQPGQRGVGGLRVFVGEQQIPAGIVLFTLIAMVIWRFRFDLPFAASLGLGGRRDIPGALRPRVEEANALLEECRRILAARQKEIARELTALEREQVGQAIDALALAMTAYPFDAAAFDGAATRAARLAGEHLGRWRKSEVREYAESIGFAVAVALLLRAFVVEAFKIPSGSMIPTLAIGDHIFVNKFTYGPVVPFTETRLFGKEPPARGDVIVFKFPENKEQDFIKRAIAVSGDTLEAINGRPIVNGWLVPHCSVGSYHYEGHDAQLYLEYLGSESYLTLFEDDPDQQVCSAQGDECAPGLSCRAGLCGALQGPFRAAQGETWVMGDNRNNSHDSRSWRGGLGGGVPFENVKGRAMFVWMSFAPGGGIAKDRLLVSVMGEPVLGPGQNPALGANLERCMRTRPPLAQTTPPPPH